MFSEYSFNIFLLFLFSKKQQPPMFMPMFSFLKLIQIKDQPEDY